MSTPATAATTAAQQVNNLLNELLRTGMAMFMQPDPAVLSWCGLRTGWTPGPFLAIGYALLHLALRYRKKGVPGKLPNLTELRRKLSK